MFALQLLLCRDLVSPHHALTNSWISSLDGAPQSNLGLPVVVAIILAWKGLNVPYLDKPQDIYWSQSHWRVNPHFSKHPDNPFKTIVRPSILSLQGCHIGLWEIFDLTVSREFNLGHHLHLGQLRSEGNFQCQCLG
ncbi:hypothetical protein AcV7_003599 [Taiwanofungus camphoratus]|nr:hypothetical protein AcV7_003599 [Antrodia cinnamomea]